MPTEITEAKLGVGDMVRYSHDGHFLNVHLAVILAIYPSGLIQIKEIGSCNTLRFLTSAHLRKVTKEQTQ